MAQSPYMATLLSGDTDVCEFQHNEYLVYQWLTEELASQCMPTLQILHNRKLCMRKINVVLK